MPCFSGDSQTMPTIVDFRQNPSLISQANNMLSQLPLFAPTSSSKGKSFGDLTFSTPVKFAQLRPHQYIFKLDSSNMAYKGLSLPQFVYGYIDCLQNSPVAQQPSMLQHLHHLMDLATSFQWPAVKVFHSRVLKAIEQGIITCDSYFSGFQIGILVPSQEIVQAQSFTLTKPSAIRQRPDKDSICKDWNFSTCIFPCFSDKHHVCFV